MYFVTVQSPDKLNVWSGWTSGVSRIQTKGFRKDIKEACKCNSRYDKQCFLHYTIVPKKLKYPESEFANSHFQIAAKLLPLLFCISRH